MNEKLILDPCCGSKMMWFDKDNPNVVFGDMREESHILCDGRTLTIAPDINMDFRALPFEDNTFHLVAFDPPHLVKLGESSWMAKKYGVLLASWKEDIKKGFDECIRVLKPNGTLVFKWNENQINLSQLLEVIETKPLFGHTSGRHGHTKWMCFMKTNEL
jgi:SAM-dependent methyltransferase